MGYVYWFLLHGFKKGVGEILCLVQTLRTGSIDFLADHFSGEDVDPDLEEAINSIEKMNLELVGVYQIKKVVLAGVPRGEMPLPTGAFKEF